MSAANAAKNERASVKVSTTIANAMDAYANVISQAIDFGTYTYTSGVLKGFTTGLDRYAPDLNDVTSTGTQTTLLSSDTVYFDKYARVYYVVTATKKNRLISKDNYVIREGDYTMADLTHSSVEAFYFTDDDVSVAVTSSNKHAIVPATAIGSQLTLSTETPSVSDLVALSTLETAIIYYSPNKRLYMIVQGGTLKRLYLADGTALAGFYQDAANTRDGLLLYSYMIQLGFYNNADNISSTAFNDLITIYPGVKSKLVTISDTVVKDADGKYYVDVIKADNNNNTNISSQHWLIPLRTRYGVHFKDGVYGETSTKAQLLSRDAYFFTENYDSLSSTKSTTPVA